MKVKNIFLINLLFITVALASGCQPSNDDLKNDFKKKYISQEGKRFESKSMMWNSHCHEKEGFSCVSKEEYLDLCRNADGISKETVSRLGKFPWAFHGKEVEHLLDNGGYSGYKIYLENDEKSREICRVEIYVSGMYSGTQIQKTIFGNVTSFVISNGQVLTYEAQEGTPY